MMELKPLNLVPSTKPPPCLNLFPTLNPPEKTLTFHKFLVLLLTFIAYAAFHASRKPPSIVKSVFGPEIKAINGTGWAPFDGPSGPHRLGELDLAFLLAYSIGMYFAGHIGDNIDLRVFLTVGMLGSGVLVIIFGLGYFLDVHWLGFFLIVQILCGLFQFIGWPCVVAVVGNWFGKAKRGLIMGVWNSNTSVGNIIGSLVASSILGFGWGWSFLLPGIFILVVAVLVYMFLVVSPDHIGLELDSKEIEMNVEWIRKRVKPKRRESWDLKRTRVLVQSVAYTFLYWLPFYLRHTVVAGVQLSHKSAGILSTIFDNGGVLAGVTSDIIEASGVTSIVFLLLSIAALLFYRVYGSVSMFTNVALMVISGALVNGPYSLLTTSVSADLDSFILPQPKFLQLKAGWRTWKSRNKGNFAILEDIRWEFMLGQEVEYDQKDAQLKAELVEIP
ncbi:hypothetical protein K7X08_021829 [Anisodus acutangulus]|uniref:Major facilitator superfamily (MFS) profile domain-containing protein n=1 Tax=Anisodus acutangulus TaxID=402998 RepID=A0A9Q1QVP0_9SOLA|nr:hypothetical protein K7X08_021829 [Anisodus acutangulus]